MHNMRVAWPDGRPGAVMSTWDDGTEFDRKLVDLFNRHGLKGSFALNSGKLGLNAGQSGWKNYVRPEEVRSLYAGHEVMSHSVSHPHPWQVPPERLRWEFDEDRRRLEALVGYPVRGAVIPYGWMSGGTVMRDLFKGLGFRYARWAETTDRFEWPADCLHWRPTAHCGTDLPTLWANFAVELTKASGSLLNIWGHSYEFEDQQRWSLLEEYCRAAGSHPGVWHATAGQVYDYLSAWRALDWTRAGDCVYNPSSQTVFFRSGDEVLSVEPGQTLALNPEFRPG